MSQPASPGGLWLTLAERLREESPVGGDGRGAWDTLSSLVDPAELRPRLAPDIEVKEFHLKWGNDYAIIGNPRDQLHYRLEPGEVELLRLMDGTRTVKEIVVERFRDSGDMELSRVADLVRQLHEGNFLDTPYVDVLGEVRRAMRPASVSRAKAREFVKTLSIEWSGAGRAVDWFHGYLRWLFHRWVIGVMSLLVVAGVVAFVADYQSHRFSVSSKSAAGTSLILLGLNFLLTFVHELGHALVLHHHGRKVKGAGFMIYFGSPAFYVESSEALLTEREQRMAQAFAGPFAELIIAGAAALFVWAAPDSSAASLLYKFALLNYLVIFLNLVPFLELDGYFILSDLIQVPDLRARSLQFVRYDFWRKLRSRERFTKQEIGLALYSFLGIAFTIFSIVTAAFFWNAVFGDLVSNLWHAGLVGRVLLIALVLFLAGPLLRGVIALIRSLVRKLRAVWRRVRFRLETKWRVEAAQLIDALPIFDDLPEDVLSDLAGHVRLRTFPAGKPAIRQGDRPEAFYVVRNGTLHVIEEDRETGKERVLGILGRGDSFGELGLVNGAARSATVRPVEDSQLFEVDKATFDHVLADMIHVPDFAPTLQAVAELRELPAFATLGSTELSKVLEHGEWVNLAPGETVIEQGDVGDAFYAIRSGQVDVYEDGGFTRSMGPGSHFGEIALLMDVPRTATVVAKTPVRLFRVDREGFDRIIARAFRKGTLDPTAVLGRTWQH